jgi:hypothetical protein
MSTFMYMYQNRYAYTSHVSMYVDMHVYIKISMPMRLLSHVIMYVC